MLFKRGQVTIFIILGILIVGTVVIFLTFKNSGIGTQIPVSLQPVYDSFLSCLEDDTLNGIKVLESQGGYIDMPPFEPGSSYMPFSSQLIFLGNPIPYWYYVSGNNIPKEQVPTISFMQEELNNFIEYKIRKCELGSYYSQGFEIDSGVPEARTKINDGKISVDLEMPLNITKANESYLINSHKIEVASNLNKLYSSALEIYSKEQKEMFLENYTVDILRNYAPVDGVEISCSPLVWNAEKVFSNLQDAIEVNIQSLKTKGGDFTLKKEENKYFIIDTEVNAKFFNSKNWTYSFEVNPSNGALLISKPIGNQQGLGILGFCYVPYHFVYDLKYPVLIQIYEGNEFFQFPFAVIIKGNVPRNPVNVTFFGQEIIPEICGYSNTLTTVHVTDKRNNPLDSNISYNCLGVSCNIGETKDGELKDLFPQCVNGNLIITAPGFKERNVLYTVMEEGEISVYLNKLYEKSIELKLDSKAYSGQAIINFISNDKTETVMYPLQRKINLTEGQYQIQISIYENSTINIPSSIQQQCIDIPQSGLGGVLGLTDKKCFDYTLPSQIISDALSGGGKEDYYILEDELKNSNSIIMNIPSLPKPNSFEQLQTNYVLIENQGLDVLFK